MPNRLSLLVVLTALACGGGEESFMEPTEPPPEEPPATNVAACAVNQELGPGQQCSLSGGAVFEVRSDGTACLGGSICAGSGITLNSFSASRITGTNRWRINSL
ncbi:MAG: hypothetical protein OXN92_08395 [Gammaproteobacteria bacterium]|nr:hypothetical protein [Gammaproteobacteria bacterium]